MPTVRNVLNTLERVAPARFAFESDRVGLQVGDPSRTVTKAAVSLDRSLGAIAFAAASECQLLLSHHPLIFSPLSSVDTRSHVGRSVVELLRADIAFIAAHTNWDCARGGVNDELAELVGLQDIKVFGTASEVKRLKLVFFCAAASADRVIDAVTEAGAGVMGAYQRCAYTTPGLGTFVPDAEARPTIGEPGKRETVDELRVEMVLSPEKQRAVARALVKAHPYEEPAFEFYELCGHPEAPDGRVGELREPRSLADLTEEWEALLGSKCWVWGPAGKTIRTVAVVGGAADGEWTHAQRAGADVLLTGEVKQHVALEASESGMCLVAAGHYATEHPGAVALRRRMAHEMPEIEWLVFAPAPGLHGRPL